MQISVKFRNATFTYCKFKNLKFNFLPRPDRDLTEEYNFQHTTIQFPIIGEDPHNAYSSIQVGWSKPITTNFAKYDKLLHRKYRQYYDGKLLETFTVADVFNSSGSDHEIFCVDFIKSFIIDTNIDKIHFVDVKCINTRFVNVIFTNTNFNSTQLEKSAFDACMFNKCYFRNINFNQTLFTDCKFVDTNFHNCEFNGKFIRANFNNVTFQCCTFDDPDTIFNNNDLTNIEMYFCRYINCELLLKEDLNKNNKE